jgi:hypothetical protein
MRESPLKAIPTARTATWWWASSILLQTLDTITDFTAYLAQKERFMTGGRIIFAAG